METDMTVAIVVAAGQGRRMETDIPKPFLSIGGEPIIAKTLRVFEESDTVDRIILVTQEEYIDCFRHEIVERYGFRKVAAVIPGGKERYDSVLNALNACPELFGWGKPGDPDKADIGKTPASGSEEEHYVFIHDGARPFVTGEILERTAEAVQLYGAVAVGVPSKDTIKIIDEEGFVKETPDRATMWQIQTPQAFRYELICAANQILMQRGGLSGVTDDAMIVEKSGLAKVRLVEGAYSNRKITTPEDLEEIVSAVPGM